MNILNSLSITVYIVISFIAFAVQKYNAFDQHAGSQHTLIVSWDLTHDIVVCYYVADWCLWW